MNTPLSWIKAYVPDLDCTAREYTDAMTLTGTKVENFVNLDEDLEKIIVGKIEKIERHPDADKLIVCQVNIGSEVTQIVTGANNVKEGDLVPVVLDGGKVATDHDGKKVAGGTKIKKGKLRGVESNGMMCSIFELGSDTNMYPEAAEDGIYLFDDSVKPGDDAIAALGLRDSVFEYEITSNRVDCYSVIGIAREAAATFRKEFVPPVVKVNGNNENVNDYIKVEIEDKDLCKRYTARVVKNVKIGPSPWWMQRRLSASGIRPINNLVDITNYVMEEFGQPMHAYDLDLIEDKKIVVKRANDGEKYTTLDGQERNLDSNILMINDGKKPVGIAGIMGGENSMITDNVKDVLFEAACFDGTNIRLSSKRLGLRTDASAKFEKGLDPNNAILAMNRACQLIEELGVGEVVGGVVDIYDEEREPVRLKFEPEKINSLLGTDIDSDEMIKYFKKIDLLFDDATNEVVVPTFRQDLLCLADLAEEVARFYGYDKIPTSMPSSSEVTGKLSYEMLIDNIAKDVAEFSGFSQAMSYSFESPKVFDKLLLDKDDVLRNAIKISNPLGEDFSIMRTVSLNGILTSLATNYNRRNKEAKLYEMSNVYIPKALPLTELPDERMTFTLGMYGDGDFFTMKGVVEEFFEKVGMKDIVSYDSKSGKTFLHPGRQANIIYDGDVVGYIGELHPLVGINYDIKTRVYIAVIDMEMIYSKTSFDRKYVGIAKYPAVSRDISMVAKKEILVGEIEEVIRKRGGKLLEGYKLFDVYEGEQIEKGFKSVAYSITFRASDRTLSDEEVNKVMDKILNGLKDLGIELRG
ncbi:phenylalanyl-tRNA synthetase beta subunit [Lachnospiraceae bacterium RM5]|nr:phenylalanyl-tRNA synthetase beta subunit [Lachnospiraceae bacterium RM5]